MFFFSQFFAAAISLDFHAFLPPRLRYDNIRYFLMLFIAMSLRRVISLPPLRHFFRCHAAFAYALFARFAAVFDRC